jgi:S-adenosylmethionine hydrolase
MKKIFLMTDFGPDSIYTGQLKSVIMSIHPKASLVDLAHDIIPQNLAQASLYLQSSLQFIPEGSVILAVVDPGVGSTRKILYIRTEKHEILCPDNGMINELNDIYPFQNIINVDYRSIIGTPISNTFHGRDIVAPIVAKLSLNKSSIITGSNMQLSDLHPNAYPKPIIDNEFIKGVVIFIDKFGNLVTNISKELIATQKDRNLLLSVCNEQIHNIKRCYYKSTPDIPMAYIGSMNTVEIGILMGNMADKYQIYPGEKVLLQHI